MPCLLIFVLALPAVLGFECNATHDGPYEIGCKSFVTCVRGIGTITECSQDQVYNSRTGACAPASEVGPPCGTEINCKNRPDGKYADQDDKCATYYTCSGGTFFGHNFCSGGLVFNERLQTCDWPADTEPPCGTKVATTTASP